MHTAGDEHKLGFYCWASGSDSEKEGSHAVDGFPLFPFLELKACDEGGLFFLLVCPILPPFSNLKMFTFWLFKGPRDSCSHFLTWYLSPTLSRDVATTEKAYFPQRSRCWNKQKKHNQLMEIWLPSLLDLRGSGAWGLPYLPQLSSWKSRLLLPWESAYQWPWP